MSYQVTARKWRPARFADMVGQEHIARTLKNAIASGRIAHAYLFVGPRGIGKTTSARIFAKALNCKHPIDGEPCCECSSCRSIADESNVDIIEIDAATHTQVDKAREICEDVLHLPIASKYKIYIIDEVHMLSKSAWNALLKTIEEPPEHARFIFATTEVNKVLPTVISRCQRFDLKRIPSELIAKRLGYIAEQENIPISPSALQVIARAADGGMRDAQSLLDQLVSFFGIGNQSEISEEQALSLFGMTAPGEMAKLLRAILEDDRTEVISSIHTFAGQGKNLESLYEEILAWVRGILLTLILPSPEVVLDENPERLADYRALAEGRKPNILQTLLEKLSESSYLLRESINKQIFLETILLKSMRLAHSIPIENLIVRLNQIRKNGELEGIEKVPMLQDVPVENPGMQGEKKRVLKEIPSSKEEEKEVLPPPPAPAPLASEEKKAEMIPPPVPPLPPPQEKEILIKEEKREIPPPPPEEKDEVPSPQEREKENTVIPAPAPLPAEEPLPEEVPPPPPFRQISAEELDLPPEKIWEKLASIAVEEGKLSLSDLMLLGVVQGVQEGALVVAFDQDYGETALAAVVADIRYLLEKLASISPLQEFRFLRKEGIRSIVRMEREKSLDELKLEAEKSETITQALSLFSGKIVDVISTGNEQ